MSGRFAVGAATLLASVPFRAIAAQSASLPGPNPPVTHGFSVLRLELGRVPRFTIAGRAWAPAVHADVAIANSRTRLTVSAARLPRVASPAGASAGVGLSVTRVLVESQSPSWMGWVTGGAATAGLGQELRDGARVWDLSAGGGAGMVFTPPGVGEVMLSLSPRLQWRRLSDRLPGLDRSTAGAAATLALDWGSQSSLGALLAFDVEWLSSRPAGDHLTQSAVRIGLSYRRLLFPRKARLPGRESL